MPRLIFRFSAAIGAAVAIFLTASALVVNHSERFANLRYPLDKASRFIFPPSMALLGVDGGSVLVQSSAAVFSILANAGLYGLVGLLLYAMLRPISKLVFR